MNSALLKGEIRAKSMTQEDVASRIGVSLSRFNAKLNNSSGAEFSLGEIRAIKALLSLDAEKVDAIFLAEIHLCKIQKETKIQTGGEIYESKTENPVYRREDPR